jgi:hypothetical protein
LPLPLLVNGIAPEKAAEIVPLVVPLESTVTSASELTLPVMLSAPVSLTGVLRQPELAGPLPVMLIAPVPVDMGIRFQPEGVDAPRLAIVGIFAVMMVLIF